MDESLETTPPTTHRAAALAQNSVCSCRTAWEIMTSASLAAFDAARLGNSAKATIGSISMNSQDLKKHLFVVEATRIAGQVQHACVLAAALEDSATAYDLVHRVLQNCIDEMSRYEARQLVNTRKMTPVRNEDDGN